ncbi:MAG: FHA domain-containing protein, partial [Planctomycetes bacterium]|nr:FHA domain-containing protein [Planctomycetota bacterium]
CKIIPVGDGYKVIDLGSRNGTYVNSVRITEHRLEPGDAIQVADVSIFFEKETKPAKPEAAKCPKCSQPMDAGAKRCPHCSADLGGTKLTFPCPACGEEQENPGEFCSFCGSDLETGLAPLSCVNCRKALSEPAADAGPCPHCGENPSVKRGASVSPMLAAYAPPLLIGQTLIILALAVGWFVWARRHAAPPPPQAVAQEPADDKEAVKKRVIGLWRAVQSGDQAALGDFVSTDKRGLLTPGGFLAQILGRESADYEPDTLKILAIRIEGDSAVVNVMASAKRVASKASKSEPQARLTAELSLPWARTDSVWHYVPHTSKPDP